MAQRGGTPRRKAWPFVGAAACFSVGSVVSLIGGDLWSALCLGSSAVGMCLLAAKVDERGGVRAALVPVLLGVSVFALVAAVAS